MLGHVLGSKERMKAKCGFSAPHDNMVRDDSVTSGLQGQWMGLSHVHCPSMLDLHSILAFTELRHFQMNTVPCSHEKEMVLMYDSPCANDLKERFFK